MQNNISVKKENVPLKVDNLTISNPLSSRTLFWPSRFRRESMFLYHMPLAFWLMDIVRPNTLIELGLVDGQSYFGFCQAMERLNIDGRCYGYSEEAPAKELLDYNEQNYQEFSTLTKQSATEALRSFKDNSIDFLVINTDVSQEAIKSLREIWRQKVSDHSIILIYNYLNKPHEIYVLEMIREISEYNKIVQLDQANGVTIILSGTHHDERLSHLAEIEVGSPEHNIVKSIFNRLGSAHYHQWNSEKLEKQARAARNQAKQAAADVKDKEEELEKVKAELCSLNEAYEARSNKLVSTQTLLFETSQKNNGEIVRLQEKILSIQQSLNQEQSLRRLEQNRVKEQSSELARHIINYEKQTQALQGEIKALEHSLEQAVFAHEKGLQKIEDINQMHTAELEACTKKIEDYEAKAQEVSRERDIEKINYEKQTQALQGEIKALEHSLEQAVSAHKKDLHRIEDSNQVHTTEVVSLITKIENCFNKAQEASREHDREKINYEQQTQSLHNKIKLLEHSLKQAVSAHEKDLQKIEDSNQVHTAEVVSLITKIEDYESSIKNNSLKLNKNCDRESFLHVRLKLSEALIKRLYRDFVSNSYYHLIHYLQFKKDAVTLMNSKVFDPEWYLTTNKDVKDKGADPAMHFICYGFYEGRNPSPHFDLVNHFINHPKLLNTDVSPLLLTTKGS
ncbi:class I SAM-dependent methyltransferase [Woodsholea maritima]|uniref:class I SAM-dependent methyltransferase n=1 Tax=Woodsholea maritima TaxID=240237 RepID=UPI0003AA5E56|nr:class I SAM-dependent methyltransferase [Woodsholea maritima]